MKRAEFLALMLSPLLAPFVTSSEPEKVVFPNGAEIMFRNDTPNIQFDYVSAHLDVAGRFTRPLPYGYRPGVKTNPSVMRALNKLWREL